MRCLGSLLLFLLQIAKPAPMPDVPAAAGLYYRQTDLKWIKLEPAPKANIKTKGMGSYVDTNGFTNLNTSIAFGGAHAAMRISNSKPTFFVRGIGFHKDVILIQFTKRKDSRTLRASTSNASVANKGGFNKDDVRKIGVTSISDDSFSVTPEDDLKSGEYLLVFGYVTTSYDFGIDSAKK